MEQATLSRRPTQAAAGSFPPGSRLPAVLQALRYARDPLGYIEPLRRRYGDVFSLRFPYFGRLVYVADPAVVKRVFTGDPSVFHAGEANATVLEPALGPSSVLTLDEDEHLRQRKLILPPFHGASVTRYGELIREITERDIETWPRDRAFSLRPHTQRITLAVILRAVFGISDGARLEHASSLVDEFSRRSHLPTTIPPLRRHLGRFSPWTRFVRARESETTCCRCSWRRATTTAPRCPTRSCATSW
jgi:cytochrome P450